MVSPDNENITLEMLQTDPFIQKYLPKKAQRRFLSRQLTDGELNEISIAKITKLCKDEQALASFLFSSKALAETAQLSPPEIKDMAESVKQQAMSRISAGWKEPSGNVRLNHIKVVIDETGMSAKIMLNKPADSVPPTVQDMLEALQAYGVRCGIKEEFLTRLAERPVYGHKFKVAEGEPAVHGRDGEAVYHFHSEADLSPHIDDDGIADYRSLDFVKNVKRGDLLCEIIPPTPGTNGFNVFGDTLYATGGMPAGITNGSNTLVAPGGRIHAACDGVAQLKNNRVLVSKVLTLDQVGAATGNILFAGAVHVLGDVAGGFLIQAGGDIVVRGIVENARLISGGNIVLCNGMKGHNTGVINAAGSIRAYFVEHAKVTARHNLFSDTLLNCKVECGDTVQLTGLNGCLIGGECTARNAIYAEQIGNDVNVHTVARLKELDSIQSQVNKETSMISDCRDALSALNSFTDKMAYTLQTKPLEMQVLLPRAIYLKLRIELESAHLKRSVSDYQNSRKQRVIVVRQTLYPNVDIEIEDAVLKGQNMRRCCSIVKKQNRLEVGTAKSF